MTVTAQAPPPETVTAPAPGPMGMCFWSRNKDDSGEFEAIITNGIAEGPGGLTINAGEFVEISGECTWNLVG